MSDLIFNKLPLIPPIKTNVIEVINSDGEVLGQFRYSPNMKHYKFHPRSFTIFSTADLIDIIEGLEKENLNMRDKYVERRRKAGL